MSLDLSLTQSEFVEANWMDYRNFERFTGKERIMEAFARLDAKLDHGRKVMDAAMDGVELPEHLKKAYPECDIKQMQKDSLKMAEAIQNNRDRKAAGKKRKAIIMEAIHGPAWKREAENKQYAKMTLREFLEHKNISPGMIAKILEGELSARGLRNSPETGSTIGPTSSYVPHYEAVKWAVEAGRRVSKRVLAEYPGLQSK